MPLDQDPLVTNEKKVEMTTKYNELKAIRDQKNKVIPRSASENNCLISKVDAIHLNALSIVRAALNL